MKDFRDVYRLSIFYSVVFSSRSDSDGTPLFFLIYYLGFKVALQAIIQVVIQDVT